MNIRHAQAAMNGIPAENIYCAYDDNGMDCGSGYIIWQYQPHLYPDCPLNLYFAINSKAEARYMLFGALIARARIMREENTNVSARVYTSIPADNQAALEFYRGNGMECYDTENLMQLQMPAIAYEPPSGCAVMTVPLNTPDEQNALCARMAANDVTWLDIGYFAQVRRMPHFCALAMVVNGISIGEIIVSGSGSSCEMVALYIHPDYRQKGYAKSLIRAAMAVMQREGVTAFCTRLSSRSLPQRALANAFNAQDIQVMTVYPSKSL